MHRPTDHRGGTDREDARNRPASEYITKERPEVVAISAQTRALIGDAMALIRSSKAPLGGAARYGVEP